LHLPNYIAKFSENNANHQKEYNKNRKLYGFLDDKFIKKLNLIGPMTEIVYEQSWRGKIYGAIFWASLVIILLWYILKSTGVIQTPLWLELLPVAVAVFGAGAVFQEMRSDIKILKFRVTHLEKDVHYVKAQI
jgi:hypothetical protein